MNCTECNATNTEEAKFCSSCGIALSTEKTVAKVPRESHWPAVIAILSVVMSLVSTAVGESASALSTLAGSGLLISAIWYFSRRIKRDGWRIVDKVIVAMIGVLFLIACVLLVSL